LLHLAVVKYVEDDDDRFMKTLLAIDFPIYEEDSQGDIPSFALALCDTDAQFCKGLKMMADKGYDVNYKTFNGNNLLLFHATVKLTINRFKYM